MESNTHPSTSAHGVACVWGLDTGWKNLETTRVHKTHFRENWIRKENAFKVTVYFTADLFFLSQKYRQAISFWNTVHCVRYVTQNCWRNIVWLMWLYVFFLLLGSHSSSKITLVQDSCDFDSKQEDTEVRTWETMRHIHYHDSNTSVISNSGKSDLAIDRFSVSCN